MPTNNYTALLTNLENLNTRGTSEGDNFHVYTQAQELIQASALDTYEQGILLTAVTESANPSGWYYIGNGIQAAINILDESQAIEVAA